MGDRRSEVRRGGGFVGMIWILDFCFFAFWGVWVLDFWIGCV